MIAKITLNCNRSSILLFFRIEEFCESFATMLKFIYFWCFYIYTFIVPLKYPISLKMYDSICSRRIKHLFSQLVSQLIDHSGRDWSLNFCLDSKLKQISMRWRRQCQSGDSCGVLAHFKHIVSLYHSKCSFHGNLSLWNANNAVLKSIHSYWKRKQMEIVFFSISRIVTILW